MLVQAGLRPRMARLAQKLHHGYVPRCLLDAPRIRTGQRFRHRALPRRVLVIGPLVVLMDHGDAAF